MALRHVKSEPRIPHRVIWDGGGGVSEGVKEHQEQRHDDGQGRVVTPRIPRASLPYGQPYVESIAEPADARDSTSRTLLSARRRRRAGDPTESDTKRLPRLIEALQGSLLLQSNVLHQLETLRASRGFVESSLQRLDAQVTLAGSGQARTDGFAADDLPSSRGDQSKTTTADFVDQIADSQGQAIPTTSQDASLVASFREDLDRVLRQETEFSIAVQSLANVQYRLKESLTGLLGDLQDPGKAAELVDQIRAPENVVQNVSEANPPTSDIPSLVELYFETKGEAGIWLDRREELLEAWAQGIEERAFIADRGDVLEVTDEDFQANYQYRLAHVDASLQNARQESDRLEQLCREAGHDPEDFRIARHSETSSDSSEPWKIPGSSITNVALDRESSTLRIASPPPPPPRPIDQWLRDLPSSDTLSEGNIALEEHPSYPDTPRQADMYPARSEPFASLSPQTAFESARSSEFTAQQSVPQPSVEESSALGPFVLRPSVLEPSLTGARPTADFADIGVLSEPSEGLQDSHDAQLASSDERH